MQYLHYSIPVHFISEFASTVQQHTNLVLEIVIRHFSGFCIYVLIDDEVSPGMKENSKKTNSLRKCKS